MVRVRPMCALCILLITALWLVSLIDTDRESPGTIGYGCIHGPTYDKIVSESTVKLVGTVKSITVKKTKFQESKVAELGNVTTVKGESVTYAGQRIEVHFPVTTKIKIGERIVIKGKVKHFAKATNMGQFDAATYYNRRGVLFSVNCDGVYASDGKYSVIKDALYSCRLRCESILGEYLSADDAAIMKAMLLGNKNEIDPQIKDDFRKSGIAHILAISGLHISFLAMGVFYFFNVVLHINVRISAVLSGILIVLYGIMVGGGTSTVRAIVMFAFFLVAKCIKRAYDSLTAMSCAAIALCLLNVNIIYDTGFRLSFLAVLAATFGAKLYNERVYRPPKYLMTLQISTLVFLFTLPTLVSAYNEVAFYSIILNLFVIPLMSVLLVAGIALLICAQPLIALQNTINTGDFAHYHRITDILTCTVKALLTLLTDVAKWIITGILYLYKGTCAALERIPIGRVNIATPTKIQVALYFVLLICALLFSKKLGKHILQWFDLQLRIVKKRKKDTEEANARYDAPESMESANARYDAVGVAVSICIAVVAVVLLCVHPIRGLQITMADVGQGDSMIICHNDGKYIIDGGSNSVREVGKYRIVPLLKAMGINKIDGIFITHPDSDHMSGIVELLENMNEENFEIACIYVYEGMLEADEYSELRELANRQGVNIVGLYGGQVICKGPLSMRVLYPYRNMPVDDINNSSLVMEVDYGDFGMITTGDVEAKGEEWIIQNAMLHNDCKILKVAHHGSDSSSSAGFIEWVKPKCALISVGENNSYGHPHKETLARLEKYAKGIRILRTDENGQITIRVSGNTTIKQL